ncbi:MAG: putative rhamnosyl transferase, partial [Tannerella sp.]|nr:putative rhamnosyl transferase [Tannerella sp.]
NDDSLSKYAVAKLQEAVEQHGYDGKIYSWLYGYQYFEKERLVVKMRYTNNHFLTLAEPYSAKMQTILSYNHAKAIKQLPFVFVKTKQGMWLETVHSDNVSNELRINSKVRYIPILKGVRFEDFGFNLRLSCLGQLAKSLFIFPCTFFFMAVKRLVTKRKRRKEFSQLSRV